MIIVRTCEMGVILASLNVWSGV